MEESESYAILDINICDKDSEKSDNNDAKKTPLTTVIKIREFQQPETCNLNSFSLIPTLYFSNFIIVLHSS